MGDIYQAPQADLSAELESSPGEYGSLEKGIRGDYQLNIGEILSEAWSLTKGAKAKILLGLLLYSIIYMIISLVGQGLVGALGFGAMAGMNTGSQNVALGVLGAAMVGGILVMLFVTAIGAPLFTGIQMMGLRRSAGEDVSPTTVVEFFGKILPLALASILMIVTIYIGFFLLFLPGVFLAVASSMTCLLIADKNIGVWRAYTSSIKGVSKKWFTVFALFLILTVINIGVMLPVMAGAMTGSSVLAIVGLFAMLAYIWLIPFSLIVFGSIYRNMFGFQPKAT